MPPCSSDQIINALIRDGFQPRGKSKRGSHQVFIKELAEGGKRIVPVPIGKREVPRGTLVSILRLAEITQERFVALL
ncbi:MAG: type II toxin-antitoxin system HicA family toxin [Dehalococcoidales bacterium]|nr:type II toxin-antitoxin system HicA family toxin [Dehalococcoidales bacterium]